MPFNVLQRRVPLIHASVLRARQVVATHQMPIHHAALPQNLGGLKRRRFVLYHNPKQRRRYKPQQLPQPVQEIGLQRAVVRRRHNNQLLPRHQLPSTLHHAEAHVDDEILPPFYDAIRVVVVELHINVRRLDVEIEAPASNLFIVVHVAERQQTEQKP